MINFILNIRGGEDVSQGVLNIKIIIIIIENNIGGKFVCLVLFFIELNLIQ